MPRNHPQFPTIQMWDEKLKTNKTFLWSSQAWKDLDAAFRAFSADQTNDALFEKLKTATEAFARKKQGKPSTRLQKGVFEDLSRFVSEEYGAITGEAADSVAEIIRDNKQVLFRALAGAQIAYKSGKRFEMMRQLHGDGEAFKGSLDQLKNRNAPPPPAPSPTIPNLPGKWNEIIKETCAVGEAVPDAVISELKTMLGEQLFSGISSAIPVLGTIKEGAAVVTCLQGIASHCKNISTIKSQKKEYTRPGGVDASIDAMMEVLKGQKVDLGIELAGATATFGAGLGDIATLGLDGGAGQIGASVAVTGAKLLRTIYSFVADHRAMTKTNEMLRSAGSNPMTLVQILKEFPMLGAHVISVLSTSSILEMNIADLHEPFFKYFAEFNRTKIEPIISTARNIVSNSRFEVLRIQLAVNEYEQDRAKFFSTLQQQLSDAINKRAEIKQIKQNKQNMNAVIKNIPAEAAKFQERRDKAAHDKAAHKAKFTPIAEEAASKLSLLEMMHHANMELESEMARLINIRAMREDRENESRRNKALAVRVQSVLETYKSQTSGFRSLITSQSDESTAAITAMNSLVNATSDAELTRFRNLVEYLLKISTKVPQGMNSGLKQLKDPSRLHGLLNRAYQSWKGDS
jgi:hypothetical protein